MENQDFLVATKKPNGGRPAIEYHLTLDMAKEVAMVKQAGDQYDEKLRGLTRRFARL